MRPIGLIGIGLLGSAIGTRFIRAGLPVVGYDLNPDRMAAWSSAGGHAAQLSEVADSCDLIVLSLPNSDAVDAVTPAITRAGTTVVDTTTGSPDRVMNTAEQLAARGIDYLDATVGGSSRQVLEGGAIVICGGSPAAFERAGLVLRHFANPCFHVGPAGSGTRMKLVTNLALGLSRAVLSEALSFARAQGLDAAVALEVLKAGPAYSRPMDTKGRKMLDGDFTPEARLAQHLKDVRLILAEAAKFGTQLPLSELHREMLQQLDEAGFGGEDNSAIIRAYQK